MVWIYWYCVQSPYQIKETQEQAAKLTSEDIPAIAKAVEDEEEEEEDGKYWFL